jgi:hypothetical protein
MEARDRVSCSAVLQFLAASVAQRRMKTGDRDDGAGIRHADSACPIRVSFRVFVTHLDVRLGCVKNSRTYRGLLWNGGMFWICGDSVPASIIDHCHPAQCKKHSWRIAHRRKRARVASGWAAVMRSVYNIIAFARGGYMSSIHNITMARDKCTSSAYDTVIPGHGTSVPRDSASIPIHIRSVPGHFAPVSGDGTLVPIDDTSISIHIRSVPGHFAPGPGDVASIPNNGCIVFCDS